MSSQPIRAGRGHFAAGSGSAGSGAFWPMSPSSICAWIASSSRLPESLLPSPRARPQPVLNPGSPVERPLTSKVAGLRLRQGDLLSVEFAGGGGWGSPYERDPERVHGDVVRNYVSRARAREDYGVVLTSQLAVDAEATARLRAQKTGA